MLNIYVMAPEFINHVFPPLLLVIINLHLNRNQMPNRVHFARHAETGTQASSVHGTSQESLVRFPMILLLPPGLYLIPRWISRKQDLGPLLVKSQKDKIGKVITLLLLLHWRRFCHVIAIRMGQALALFLLQQASLSLKKIDRMILQTLTTLLGINTDRVQVTFRGARKKS